MIVQCACQTVNNVQPDSYFITHPISHQKNLIFPLEQAKEPDVMHRRVKPTITGWYARVSFGGFAVDISNPLEAVPRKRW